MSKVWNGSSMLEFCDVRRRRPSKNQSLTQLDRGHLEAHAKALFGSDAITYLATVGSLSNTMIELDSNYTGLVVPIRWRGDSGRRLPGRPGSCHGVEGWESPG